MKLGFLDLSPDERRLYIEQAAIQRNVSAVILEKDFWVCWLLGILFESEFAGCLVFKGGTSLSKVFGVIERFSEDIDLSLSPEFLKLPACRDEPESGEQVDDEGRGRLRSRRAKPDRARVGSGGSGSPGKEGPSVVRVPDGSRTRTRRCSCFTTPRRSRTGLNTSNVR